MALSCQVTRKLKRAAALEFTTISAIIFIHRWQLFLNFQLLDIFYNYSFYFDCVASSQLSVRKEEAGSKFVSNKVPCTQLRQA